MSSIARSRTFARIALVLAAALVAGGSAVPGGRTSPSPIDWAWIEVGDQLRAVDPETGALGRTVPLPAGGSLLAAPSTEGRALVRVPGGFAALPDLEALFGFDGTEEVARTADGGWIVATSRSIERLSPAGRIEWSRSLIAGERVLALAENHAWLADAGGLVGFAFDEDQPTRVDELETAAGFGAHCLDPLTQELIVATRDRLVWIAPSGRVRDQVALAGVRAVACARFGTIWVQRSGEVLLVRSTGERGRVEQRIGTDPTAGVSIAVDPRDNSLLLATGRRLERWSRDGERLWRVELDEPIRTVAIAATLEARVRLDADPADGERATPDPKSGHEASLDPDEIAFRGQLTDPYGRPVASGEFAAFGREIARATSDAAGQFVTGEMPYLAGDQVLLYGSEATPVGMARTYPWASSFPAGTEIDLGPLALQPSCWPDFEASLFPANDLNGEVRAIAVFDDGSGPALFVGGTFTTARGVTVNRVAKWNGSSWSALGSGLGASSSPSVDALLVFDDGSGPKLHAGGNFTSSGAATVRYVARWTGSTWVQVGSNLGAQVLALGAFNPGSGNQLFATGAFTTPSRIARLSGSSWVAVGSGLNNTGRALVAYGSHLYAGGSFTTAGGVSTSRIARWNGSSWSAVGSGVSGGSPIQVNALVPWTEGGTPVLAVGGRFTTAGATTVNHVARWNGAAWSAIGGGLGVQVNALAAFDAGWGPSLFAAGTFTTISGEAFQRVAQFEAGAWRPLGVAAVGVNGSALALKPGTIGGLPSLFVGGAFTSAGGNASSRIARWAFLSTCDDFEAPSLKIVDPSPGESTADTTPPIRIAFADPGIGVDTSSLVVRVAGQPVAASCSFSTDVADCTPVQPLVAGTVELSATIEDLAGNLSLPDPVVFSIAETDPPILTIVEPAEDGTVATLRPPIRFQYSDLGAGVDPSSLEVTWNGVNLALDCQSSPSEALCVPTSDRSEGVAALVATVRDFQGNLSSPATRGFIVDAPTPLATTVRGSVRLQNGSAAATARVWLVDRPALFAIAAADGSYQIPNVELPGEGKLELAARHTAGNPYQFGFASVPPVPGGETVVDLDLKVKCFGNFTPLALEPKAETLSQTIHSLSNAALTFEAFDDGDGADLYAGGSFNVGSGGELRRIARWGSGGWENVGWGISHDQIQPDVRAFAVFDDGRGRALYAGGEFTWAGSTWANHLARWNGTAWEEVGRGVEKQVHGLAVFDDGDGPILFVSGEMTRAGTRVPWTGVDESVGVGYVATWDGETWQNVGAGLSPTHPANYPLKLSVLGSGVVRRLFLWEENGERAWERVSETWSEIGLPPGSFGLTSLALHDDGAGPKLYVAAKGAGVVRWSGSGWTTLLADDMYDKHLASFADGTGSFLYAAGNFPTLPGDDGTAQLRRWAGSVWSPPLGPAERIQRVEGDLAAPMLLRTVGSGGGTAPPFGPPASWGGGAWTSLAAASEVEGSVTSVAFAESGAGEILLFAGPARVGSLPLDGAIARWDGSSVTVATSGLPDGSRVFGTHDGLRRRAYAVAESSGQIAEWMGDSWQPMGAPVAGEVHDVRWIEVGGERRLYAAGDGLFRWNGAFWSPIAGAPTPTGFVEGFGGQLYTSGRWRWNGSTWSQLPTPPSSLGEGAATDLVWLHDPDLPEAERRERELEAAKASPSQPPPESIVSAGPLCGGLQTVGSLLHFAGQHWAWNGSTWVAGTQPRYGYVKNRFLSGTIPQSQWSGSVCRLASFDDGSGAALVVGGDFAGEKLSPSTASILPYRNVSLGHGVDGPKVAALSVGTWQGSPALVVGGDLGEAEGISAGRLALWHAGPTWETCSTGGPPAIVLTSPQNPLTNLPSLTVSGALDESADLTVDGATVDLAPDFSFDFETGPLREGENRFFLRAVDATDLVSTLDYVLVRDSTAPVVSFVAPPAGASLYTGRPRIELEFEEAGSGVDPGTLEVSISGAPLLGAACIARDRSASCQPPTPLPLGPATLRASVRDRAGNLSTLAERAITVESNGESTPTTVVGTVRFLGGGAAAGARVRILGRSGLEASTVADGTFSLVVADVVSNAPLRVIADLVSGPQVLSALSQPLAPVPNGTTDAGVLTLAPACDLAFSADLFGSLGVDGRVLAAAIFDSGDGPQLYLGGTGLLVTSGSTSTLARWNGASFEAVPGAPASGSVRALAAWDPGTGPELFVGGTFTLAGGMAVQGLASWDGAVWRDVGGGVTYESSYLGGPCTGIAGSVYSLLVAPDGAGAALFVGGSFNKVGAGIASDLVAKWDGGAWSSLGAPPSCPGTVNPPATAYALAAYDDGNGETLFAAGNFSAIGGVPAHNIARRGGAGWAPVESGIGRYVSGSLSPSMVNALVVYDGGEGPELVAAGLFNRAGSTETAMNSIARWNGERWAPLEEGLEVGFTTTQVQTGIQALAVYDVGGGPELYAAGRTSGTTLTTFGRIARWNGTGWRPVAEGVSETGEGGMVLLPWGAELLVGGGFADAGGRSVRNVARWNGQRWRPYGDGLDGDVEALAVYDDGSGPALYVGGAFVWAGERRLDHVARFDGTSLHPLGGGVDGTVLDLDVHDDGTGPALYAGGRFAHAGGASASNVARWNGSTWSPLGAGISTPFAYQAGVSALQSYDDGGGPGLYAGGNFSEAGGVVSPYLARWRGGLWTGLGAGVNGEVLALEHATVGGVDGLFVGGSFSQAGGAAAANVARWNGAWSALGTGLSGTVRALVPWGTGQLLAGGAFADRFRLWNGTAWSVPPGGGGGTATVESLAAWHDGAGLAAFAGRTSGVGRWSGTAWTTLGAGVESGAAVRALAALDEPTGSALYLGGSFDTAGGESSAKLARWHRPPLCNDTTGPVITIVAPSAGSWVAQSLPSIELTIVDTHSSVDLESIEIRIDGAQVTSSCSTSATPITCWPTAPLTDGPHSLSVSARDELGNVGTAGVEFSVDTAYPTVTFYDPAPESILASNLPTLRFLLEDVGSGAVPTSFSIRVEATVDVAFECSYSATEGACVASEPIDDTRLSVFVGLRDVAGNAIEEVESIFYVDTQAPSFAIDEPLDGAVVYQTTPRFVIVFEDAATAIDTTSLVATIDGVPFDGECAWEASTASCTSATPWMSGGHTIAASIEDGAGHRSATDSVAFSVVVDTEAPTVSFVAPSNGSSFDPQLIPFELAWSDSGTGVDETSLTVLANEQLASVQCESVAGGTTCRVPQRLYGEVVLRAQVADRAGNRSASAAVFFTVPGGGVDSSPPVIHLVEPANREYANQPSLTLRGTLSEAASLRIDGVPAVVYSDRSFRGERQLSAGLNTIVLTATDPAGNAGELSFEIVLDTSGPGGLVDGLLELTPSVGGVAGFSGAAGCVATPEEGSRVVARSARTGAVGWALVGTDGAFSGQVSVLAGAELEFRVVDRAGNEGPAVNRDVVGVDPVPMAPDPFSPGSAKESPFCREYSFLWSSAAPVQFGVADDGIDCARVGVVRARVVDGQGTPITGARVHAPRDARAGIALTRADGWFDLALNAGGDVTIQVDKQGYLPVTRRLELEWHAIRSLADIALPVLSEVGTIVDLALPAEITVALGRAETDEDGTRTAVLMFPSGTAAQAILAEGGQQPLPAFTVRATEYTVGSDPASRLPAPLPDGIDPTYVLDLAVDELSVLGATGVTFDPPLPAHVENFRGFPTGTVLLAASWDPEALLWRPEEDGRVVEILAESAGSAILDTDGTGNPASEEQLASLGISGAELRQLAVLHSPGETLMRWRVPHFSSWFIGLGWLVTVAEDAAPPRDLEEPSVADERRTTRPSLTRFGGTIDAENRALGQAISLTGSPLSLVYWSDRVAGRATQYTIEIPVTGPIAPAGAVGIEVVVEVAGRREVQTFPVQPNLSHRFVWDGLDAFGKARGGAAEWRTIVSYLRPGSATTGPHSEPRSWVPGTRSFLLPLGLAIDLDGRGIWRFSRETAGSFPAFDAREAFGLGGWSLDVLHRYDPLTRRLSFGGGGQRFWGSGPESNETLRRVAGTGIEGTEGDDGPARDAQLHRPAGVSPMRDGGLLIVDNFSHRLRLVDRHGFISTLAGANCSDPENGPLGDGGPAANACLFNPTRAVEGPDGAIFIADSGHRRVRRIDVESGDISTYASLLSPDCDPEIHDLDVDSAGVVYVVARARHYESWLSLCSGIRAIPAPGSVVSVDGEVWFDLHYARSLDVLDGGRIAVGLIERLGEITPQGAYSKTLPGTGAGVLGWFFEDDPHGQDVRLRGDGQLAQQWWTRFDQLTGIAVARDGTTYVADRRNRRIRAVTPDGIINTIAGGGSHLARGDGHAANSVALMGPHSLALSPDETKLYFSDPLANMVWEMSVAEPREREELYEIPSSDGAAIYVFDVEGYHLRTESATTRRRLWEFTYQEYPGSSPDSPMRRLVTEVKDAYSNLLQIERSGEGEPLAIVAPFGQRTTLVLDANGYLASVGRTVGSQVESVGISAGADGLLEAIQDPNGGSYQYAWDDLGRLAGVEDPAGRSLDLMPLLEEEKRRTIGRSTEMARTSSVDVNFGDDRALTRTEKDTVGMESAFASQKNRTFTLSAPAGEQFSLELEPDWVYQPFVEATKLARATLPSGLSQIVEQRTTGFATDPSDDLRTVFRATEVEANGRVARAVYSGAAQTITSTSPAGRVAVAHLDEFSRVTHVDAPGSLSVRRFFDSRGRLERLEQGTGPDLRRVVYGYDPTTGYLDSITDALDRTVRFERDEAGRLLKQILPDMREIGFDYDANGNVTSITPPTRPAHAFDYTPIDQVEAYTPPDVGISPRATVYGYNADGQVTSVTRPDNQQILVSYESNGRTDFVTLPTGVVDVSYDGVGRVGSITAPGGVGAVLGYDGPLVTSMQTTGPVPGTVSFAYDNDFELTSLGIAGTAAIPFEYDEDGLLTQAGSLVLSRDAASGRLDSTTLASTTDVRTRTAFGELDTYAAQVNSSPLYSFDLDRDAAGRIVRKTETIEGTTSVWEYAYHPQRGWLTEVRKDGSVVATYGYDPNGNRTSWTDFWGSGSATYDDQDRQLAAGTASYTYTANGERLTKAQGGEVTTYEYDVRGALLGVDLPNGIQIDYLVDAGGRRIGKKVNGELVQGWLYAGGLAPIAEVDPTGAITATYVYATKSNVPDYIVRGATTYRVFTDHLGSVRLVVDAATGTIAQRLDYDAYGRITFDSAPGFQPFAFAGGRYDPQTGLVRFGARDCDPEVGRWTAKDPIGFAGGSAGLYTYVENDAINSSDPSGLCRGYACGDLNQIHRADPNWRQGTAAKRAALATGAVVAAVGAAYVAELAYMAASYCLVQPTFCTEMGVSIAEVAAGVDGPSATPIGAGSDLALGLARHGATGSAALLTRFARKVDARTYGDIYGGWSFDSFEQLESNILSAMRSSSRIHFNLDQMNLRAFQEFAGNPRLADDNITNWELFQVLNDPDLLKKTIFYGAGGAPVQPPGH